MFGPPRACAFNALAAQTRTAGFPTPEKAHHDRIGSRISSLFDRGRFSGSRGTSHRKRGRRLRASLRFRRARPARDDQRAHARQRSMRRDRRRRVAEAGLAAAPRRADCVVRERDRIRAFRSGKARRRALRRSGFQSRVGARRARRSVAALSRARSRTRDPAVRRRGRLAARSAFDARAQRAVDRRGPTRQGHGARAADRRAGDRDSRRGPPGRQTNARLRRLRRSREREECAPRRMRPALGSVRSRWRATAPRAF